VQRLCEGQPRRQRDRDSRARLGAPSSQLGGARLRRRQQLGEGPAPAGSVERQVPASRRRRSREPSLDHHAHRLAVAFAA